MQIIAARDVADVQHWFDSAKRGEFFPPRGIQVSAFRDPAGVDPDTIQIFVAE